jgi:hypothetical protein
MLANPHRAPRVGKETIVLLCLEGPGSQLLARSLTLGEDNARAADYWPAPCRGHPLLPAPGTPFADLASLEAALAQQWRNEVLRASAEGRILLVAEGLGAIAALGRRLAPSASPARLGALLLALLDSAASEGAVDFLWLSTGPGAGEPAVSHAFADAQHPRLFLNAGKLSLTEQWEALQAHGQLKDAAFPPAPYGVALAPLPPKQFAGGYALTPEPTPSPLPFPRHRLTGPALAGDGEQLLLGPSGQLAGLTRRLSLQPLASTRNARPHEGFVVQEDGLTHDDLRSELPAVLVAEGGSP